MALSATNAGIFSKLYSMFKSRDPLKREILQSAGIIDRMLRSLETSKKNLETAIEEHKKRLKVQGDDKELAKIIDEEIKNIYGYLSMITKTVYDLARVKYRLETLFYVEEPLKIIPEVLEELRSVEPVIEKINPQLINQIKTLEQRVASIMALSSSYIPGITGISNIPQQLVSAKTDVREQKPAKSVEGEITRTGAINKQVQSVARDLVKSAELKREKTIDTATLKKAEVVQVPSVLEKSKPEEEIPKDTVKAKAVVESNIPLHIVEQWLLNELKVSGGVLDIKLFEKKYGVKRDVVLEAIRSLEAKNIIRVRRR